MLVLLFPFFFFFYKFLFRFILQGSCSVFFSLQPRFPFLVEKRNPERDWGSTSSCWFASSL